MSSEALLDAIGELPEDLLAPVEALRKKKSITWVPWASLAAACLLILVLPFALPQFRGVTAESAKGDFAYSNQEAAPENAGMLEDTAGVSETQETFRAEVLEVHEGTILVRPLEGEPELRSADKIYASFRYVQEVPAIKVGDIVEIIYNGMLQETYPATAVGVTTIRVVQ